MKNYFLYSIIFILLSAVLYALVIKPWYTVALVKYEHISMLRKVFAQGEELQSLRDKLQADFNSVPISQRDLVVGSIPAHSQKNVILFLIGLDELIGTSGLPLDTNYSVGKERENAGTVIVPITFNFGGVSYRLLRGFMSNLQRWEKGVRIRSLDVGHPVDGDSVGDGFVRAHIVIEALFSSV